MGDFITLITNTSYIWINWMVKLYIQFIGVVASDSNCICFKFQFILSQFNFGILNIKYINITVCLTHQKENNSWVFFNKHPLYIISPNTFLALIIFHDCNGENNYSDIFFQIKTTECIKISN